jgi:hemolysin III
MNAFDPIPAGAPLKPRLRGVSHQYAFFISLACGAALVLFNAGHARTLVSAIVYAVAVSALLGTSALYHRVHWQRPNVRVWMRRLDHSMIYVLIAGSYTPFALLAMHGTLSTVVLALAWGGALAGVLRELVWANAPKWVSAITYMALGWVAVITLGQLMSSIGLLAVSLVALSGLFYTVGAVVYARERPNPLPGVFGYHEVFHALVILAAAIHYAVIAFIVLPLG